MNGDNLFFPFIYYSIQKGIGQDQVITCCFSRSINSRLDQFETIEPLRESTHRIEEKLEFVVRIHSASRRPRCRMSRCFPALEWKPRPERSVVTSRRLMTPDYAAICHEDACISPLETGQCVYRYVNRIRTVNHIRRVCQFAPLHRIARTTWSSKRPTTSFRHFDLAVASLLNDFSRVQNQLFVN